MDNTCQIDGTRSPQGCLVCGCSSEFDSFGDRICFCDSCQLHGCQPTVDDVELTNHGNETFRCNSCETTLPQAETWDCAEEVHDDNNASHCKGMDMWKNATQWQASKRRAANGYCYSLAEFEVYYGQAQGRSMWEEMPINDIRQILLLCTDVERRTALHLAHLRKWPKIRTPCCHTDYCFRCQTAWHSDRTCEEVVRLDVDVQFCPGCNVPTLRTEGCSSMVCLCGENWEWEGGSDYSDDDY